LRYRLGQHTYVTYPGQQSNHSNLLGNYPPISLLTNFSKIFERIFYSRLSDFLKKQKVLFQFQFGFRTNHSTDMALTILLDKIIDALEKGHLMVGIFLDFSKAFDTVNHSILLAKLNRYGIRGISNDWVRIYLDNRSQFCTHDGIRSNTKHISCGVPQGSILGPLLFLLYVNDLHRATANLDIILYADDSNLFLKGNTLTEIQSKMNIELPNLVTWL
jgi:retron-type reverse transcriptase